MKIDCKEHYDKIVEYARSIGDTTFQNCILKPAAPHISNILDGNGTEVTGF